MKNKEQPLIINKKLILHFDIDSVIRIPPASVNKDFYVYNLCAGWVWGKLERNSKEDPNKITGWKLASNSLSKEQPEPDTITYKQYLEEYLKPQQKQLQNLILNLSKGPAAKAKAEIQKTIRNITIPKALHDVIKDGKDVTSKLQKAYIETGKYQILPAFYKTLLNLKKNKREFAIVIKTTNTVKDHRLIIDELNLFFSGEHPLYNGKNGVPLVKMDGTNKSKNFVFEDSHFEIIYQVKNQDQVEFIASFGSGNFVNEKDPELLKQTLKNSKKLQICEGAGEIYSYSHSILAESAFIYEINPNRVHFIDEVDYLTHQIIFSNSNEETLFNVLGKKVQKNASFFENVDQFQLLRDVDYFVKKIEQKQALRVQDINRIEKGEQKQSQKQDENAQQQKNVTKPEQTDAEYLKRTIIPLLDGALRQVDLFRPEDPIGFVALYCLKNRQRIE